MAKHKLPEPEAALNAAIIGISCHVPDYRLCWSINRALGIDMARRKADIVEEVQGKRLHYPVFEQCDDQGEPAWALVCNTCGKRRLIPGQRLADHFLLVNDELAATQQDLLGRVRSAEFVLTAFAIDPADLRMGHKLLL
jgi:hypothetical protein